MFLICNKGLKFPVNFITRMRTDLNSHTQGNTQHLICHTDQNQWVQRRLIPLQGSSSCLVSQTENDETFFPFLNNLSPSVGSLFGRKPFKLAQSFNHFCYCQYPHVISLVQWEWWLSTSQNRLCAEYIFGMRFNENVFGFTFTSRLFSCLSRYRGHL